MATYIVQDCGCIATPGELPQRTGLYPGTTFHLQVAAYGSSVTLLTIQPFKPQLLAAGTNCSTGEISST